MHACNKRSGLPLYPGVFGMKDMMKAIYRASRDGDFELAHRWATRVPIFRDTVPLQTLRVPGGLQPLPASVQPQDEHFFIPAGMLHGPPDDHARFLPLTPHLIKLEEILCSVKADGGRRRRGRAIMGGGAIARLAFTGRRSMWPARRGDTDLFLVGFTDNGHGPSNYILNCLEKLGVKYAHNGILVSDWCHAHCCARTW